MNMGARNTTADATPATTSANTASGLYSSDLLLQAVSTCIAEILQAESVTKALPDTLREIAKIVRIDRMVMIEMLRTPQGEFMPSVFFTWQSDEAPEVDARAIIASDPDPDAMHEWIRPLPEGKAVIGVRRQMQGSLYNLLTKMQVESIMQVPIMINGVFWGQIVFEDCKSVHEWSSAQINILKLFAELVGTAVTRERSNQELHQRDALLSAVTASAVEIMTAPYLHEAISKSLETVAKAVRADRMFVLEVAPGMHGSTAQMLLRNSWHTPSAAAGLETVMRALSAPATPDIIAWSEPLLRGHAITGRRSEAKGTHKELLEKLSVQSTLIVPIMVDGKYWGHVSFDDCNKERDWSSTEVDILKMLAELIGTAITRERYIEELAKANTIVQNSPTILYRLRGEPSFPMIYVSQNVSLLGHSAEDLLDSPTLYHSYVHPEDRAKVQGTMVELLRKNAAPVTIEYRMLTNSGDSRWMENRYTPVRDTNGRLVEVEGIMIDITERKLAEDRIALLARTDVLTGLANRATFNDRLRQAFAAAQRGANSFAVLYLDLDRFKEVNDTRGHPVGDKLLQSVAERLKSMTRETDVVARLGGDEFAILQTDVTDPALGGTLANKIIDSISAPYDIDGQQSRIGTSVGIAVFSREAISPDTLLTQADQALYRAKEEGRGQYRFHSDELDLEARERVSIGNDLRGAMERNELELHYQPQVELSSGRIVGMEALIRWKHPTRGLLLPDAFLPIAEKAGMIQAVGRWVLNGACKQLAEWRQEGVNVPVVAVNIALSQIKTGREFVRDVKDSLSRWNLQPSDLELDVTEFILARTTLAQSDVLEELQRLGVCIAIDDFGAQYSSLDYLRTYHVGRLKIARPMVAAAQGERGGSMIRAIMVLASELGIEVVAEGVETEEQRAVLVDMSSKAKGQGYFFSQPMPAEDTTAILRLGLVIPTEQDK